MSRAVEKAVKAVEVSSNVLEIKDSHGVINDWARETIAELTGVDDIPANSSFRVFERCATKAGMEVRGSWDRRTVPRVMHEVAQAAEMLIVERFLGSIGSLLPTSQPGSEKGILTPFTGLSLSGDGASHNNIQFSSRHITSVPADPTCCPKNSFIGVHPELNHKTATQLEGWKKIISEFCATHNEHPDAKCVVDPANVWQLARGYLGDHAADQKKLSVMLEAYRRDCDREIRGEDVFLSDDPQDEVERNQLLDEMLKEMLEKAGGLERWALLPPIERLKREKGVIREVQVALGEKAYQQLSQEEKDEIDFWVYTGCAMHKDLNAAKGGADRMAKSWEKEGRTPPISLMSKAQATATESGSAPKKGKGGRQSDRGGPKLTSLLGALVKNKNPKKGHQARFRVYCRKVLGFEILFPDTSNNRYQSHGYAATEIIHRRQLYTDFLLKVQGQKAMTGGLNHMEGNILIGLMDDATFTELQVMALYSQAISLPLAELVRAPHHQPRNGLDLSPDFDHLIDHIEKIIEDPNILIGPDVSSETATLDGQPWHNPEAISIILGDRDRYPHLKSALVEYFKGTLEAWRRFTRDLLNNPKLSAATPEQRYLAFRYPVNDHNEGALGFMRRITRAFPRLTFAQLNARLTCR